MTFLLSPASFALGSADTTKATIVLVHGAFADGSSWARVIPLLENDGYTVIAMQKPLTSLADDVMTARGVITAQKCPVLAAARAAGTNLRAARSQLRCIHHVRIRPGRERFRCANRCVIRDRRLGSAT